MNAQIGLFIGLMVGLALSSQGAINGRLAGHLGGALPAAVVSFSVGLSALILVTVLLRQPWPGPTGVAAAPWWTFLGGFLGATVVACAAYFVPQIGVATWAAAIIAGQLIGAMVIDHNGWLSVPVRSMDVTRIAGALCLALGVYLVQRGGR
ncbi:MAG: DMT family transporter [Parvularculaceae bacterium]|nr:DMT family transporter [Parvularculaceae bacterium]